MKIQKQIDQKDCGLYVLQYFIKKYTKSRLDIDYLKMIADYGADGISLSSLASIAKKYNLNLESYYGDFESLYSLHQSNFPIAILINKDGYLHYVIIEKIQNKTFFIQDSALGKKIKISEEELKPNFKNVVIFVNKMQNTTNWEIGKVNKISNKISDLFVGNKYTYPLLISSLISLFLTFGSTFFVKIVFDNILPNFLKTNLIIIFILFVWINVLRFFNQYLKNIITKKIANKIEISLTNSYFQKLNNCSLNELNKLTESDYLKRISFINLIANYQANFTYTFLSQIFSIIGGALLLLWLNYILFSLVLGLTIICFLINFIYQNLIEKQYQEFIQNSINKNKTEFDEILSIKNSKSAQYKKMLTIRRIEKMITFKEHEYKMFFWTNNKNLINEIILGNLSIIVIFVSSFLFFENKISIGEIMMFLTCTTFFVNPIISISNLIVQSSIINKNSNMINFVLNLKEHKNNGNLKFKKIKKIELQNIKFGFEQNKTILNIPEMIIDKNIQIFGNNGTGKSTFMLLLNNALSNYSGTYKINNNDINNYSQKTISNKLIYINNKDFLPEIKVIDYITNQNNKNLEEFTNNLQNTKLAQVINSLKLNLTQVLQNNGSNISLGQRQLIIIMKLFTRKYDVILLDEVFENLDSKIVKILKSEIKKYQNEGIFIETSHNKNYIFKDNEVNFEKINKN
ncbi:Mbov_0121 family peptidase domain-containing ABC transporter [Mycoplasmopsis lipofaciens]|uniref:Mbov_0121 family peptidase domain-containing ABC transporter n=1 Tax=Mycoplasmopsis lipofaciens TaxID=114884 RepID=UPI000481690E|nr:cysteine peptidase family C39 domain-containing protein [Mycoplasmopsis lipofaciens]